MKILSQKDPRWSKEKIGKSDSTIGRYGCTITCLSMLSDWYGDYKRPDWLAKNLSFTNEGKILWKSIDGKLPFNFEYRFYTFNEARVYDILVSKDNSCVLQVNNYSHWVLPISFSKITGYRIADPLDGTICYLNRRYKDVNGFTEFSR